MSVKGLTGLINLGNTCFINTTLQVLSYISELHELKPLKKNDDSILLHEWNLLRNLMFSENCTVRPARFIHCIQIVAKQKQNEQFAELEQNDMTEFFLFLIDCFHNSISRTAEVKMIRTKDKTTKLCLNLIKETFAKEYSEIYDIFYGIHISQISSLDGSEVYSVKPEYFRILDLPITSDSLQDCLQNYMDGEILQDDNQWFNETAGCKMDVRKCLLLWKLPKILTIAFKRFRNTFYKNQMFVDFPLDDLTVSDKTYELFAVVNHFGALIGGHYSAYLKNQENQKWYEYNDTIVREMSPDEIVTPRAYCILYRQKG